SSSAPATNSSSRSNDSPSRSISEPWKSLTFQRTAGNTGHRAANYIRIARLLKCYILRRKGCAVRPATLLSRLSAQWQGPGTLFSVFSGLLRHDYDRRTSREPQPRSRAAQRLGNLDHPEGVEEREVLPGPHVRIRPAQGEFPA